MSWKRVGRGPLPGLHYLLASQSVLYWPYRVRLAWDCPWYAHFMQHGEYHWRESSGILRGSQGYPRVGPLHEMHGERTPWPGVGVLSALCSVL